MNAVGSFCERVGMNHQCNIKITGISRVFFRVISCTSLPAVQNRFFRKIAGTRIAIPASRHHLMELPVLHQPLTIVLLIGLDDGSLDGALRNAGAAALDVINRALVTRLPNASLILRNASSRLSDCSAASKIPYRPSIVSTIALWCTLWLLSAGNNGFSSVSSGLSTPRLNSSGSNLAISFIVPVRSEPL
ncbi:Uncharacterised protein [Klebsiella pneumoniae]|nr:Uncharacterised protein [Klebsiella pneumoniae]